MTRLRNFFRAAGLISLIGCLLLVAGLILLSKLDTVESRYDSYATADADRLFARGWLPPIIPGSSREIVTKNDLDLNLSEGGFRFDREDLEAFLSQLARAPDLDSGRFDAYKYEGWVFFISSGDGDVECKYRFRLNR